MPTRYLLVGLTFCLSLLLYIDRACISVAKDEVMSEFGLTSSQWGWAMAIFTLGYALAQTPTGTIADRSGPRVMLTLVVFLWSVMTAVTGAVTNFVSLMIARFVFGATEAGAFPGLARASLTWYPVRERGLVTGINFSASRLGASLAMPLMTILIAWLGWRQAFYVLGAVGAVFAALWFVCFRDDPADHPLVSDEEKDYIVENRQKVSSSAAATIPFSQIISSPSVWLAMLQYFCSNFTFFFCLTWLFPYLKDTYELTQVNASLLCALPFIGGAVGNWFSGWLVDFLFVRNGLVWSRRIPAIIGFTLAAIGVYGSLQMTDATSTIAFFTLAIFGADMTLSPSWSYCVDIGGKSAGAVSGTMNMAGNIGAFATAIAYPYLKEWYASPEPFFYVAAGLNVVAIVTWLFIRADRPIEVVDSNIGGDA
jgi:ACS family glucarate transporter-like MFS transporter